MNNRANGNHSPERLGAIQDLAKQGLSFREIGLRMNPPLSRNAVAGILHRAIGRTKKPRTPVLKIVEPPAVPPARPALVALAEFDPVLMRALRLRG